MALEASVVISLLAFAVSVSSFAVSLLAYFRDRSKVRTWSEIIWDTSGIKHRTPFLHVYVVNEGRRPVVMLNLLKRHGASKWWAPIKQPNLSEDIFEAIKQLKKSPAQDVAVRLAEGEILEIVFDPDDCPEFIADHEDPPVEATELQIQDVTGKIYPVKNSASGLKTLFEAWMS